jgi:hypothetical protein
MADQQGIAANAMPAGYGTYTAVPVEEKGIGDVLHSAGSYAKKEFHKAKVSIDFIFPALQRET